ncbi:Low-density lipoprotein receptor-related protein 4 [Nymphon striatum]|nr:Low-density lipoprotein receptor-related protein 4 [Nymphon striatum]
MAVTAQTRGFHLCLRNRWLTYAGHPCLSVRVSSSSSNKNASSKVSNISSVLKIKWKKFINTHRSIICTNGTTNIKTPKLRAWITKLAGKIDRNLRWRMHNYRHNLMTHSNANIPSHSGFYSSESSFTPRPHQPPPLTPKIVRLFMYTCYNNGTNLPQSFINMKIFSGIWNQGISTFRRSCACATYRDEIKHMSTSSHGRKVKCRNRNCLAEQTAFRLLQSAVCTGRCVCVISKQIRRRASQCRGGSRNFERGVARIGIFLHLSACGFVKQIIFWYMYWTDWGEVPKIERAGMDGTQRTVIVGTNLTWPNGLAIDYENETLYWTDAGMKAIECSNLDGTNRKILRGDLPHPFGLTLHEDRIYWTDWKTKSIASINKQTGRNKIVHAQNLENLMDIHVFDENIRQHYPTPCTSNNGGCSHLCLLAPLNKGYSCACPTGITLIDSRTCTNGMMNFFVIARRSDLRLISFDVDYFADVILPIKELKDAIAVDVDRKTGLVYWSDSINQKIMSCDMTGSNIRSVLSIGIRSAYGIAVDSTGRKIYWTDAIKQKIEVSTLDGSLRKVLIGRNLDSPRAIVLHYHYGVMFWADWGNQPRIERADMDGNNRKVIVSENLGWPNGLTIDRPNSQLYWADAKTKVIEASDLEGKNRRVLVSSVQHPYGVTILGEHVYWTDWELQAVVRASKETGGGRQILQDGVPERSACGTDNGGCSHLCLRQPKGLSCACPTGIHLKPDKRTCFEYPHKSLLFVSTKKIQRISFDTDDATNVPLQIPDVKNAIGLSYHYRLGRLYFTDVDLDVIRFVTEVGSSPDLNPCEYLGAILKQRVETRIINGGSSLKVVLNEELETVRLDGSDVKTILKKDLETVDGLAVDWIANNIYLTDAGRNVIEVCRLDGSSRKILVDLNLDEPRAIAVHPIKGFMFWSDWGENPKIERSFLDGSNRKIIVSSNLAWPNDLSIDYKMKKLYWADAKLDKIEYSDFNGKNRRIVLTSLPHPFGLTMDDSHIYWTDWKTKSIEKADKLKGQNRVIILSDIEGLRQLRMVSAFRQSDPIVLEDRITAKYFVNGFILSKSVIIGYICACPTSTDDKVPCSNVPGIVTEDPLFWTSKPTRRTTSRFHLTTPSRPQQQHVKIGSGPGLENNTSKNGSCADERCSPDSPQPPMSEASVSRILSIQSDFNNVTKSISPASIRVYSLASSIKRFSKPRSPSTTLPMICCIRH